MRTSNIDMMKGGWFIGNFEPSLYKTTDCEFAVKKYKKGDYEAAHFHKIATEFTVIINGEVKMFEKKFVSGDIVIVEPGDTTDFMALSDVITVVAKIPGANNDKYLV